MPKIMSSVIYNNSFSLIIWKRKNQKYYKIEFYNNINRKN